MPSRNRNILLKILIVIISLSMFGFQDLPANTDPKPAGDDGPLSNGFVEVILYGQASGGSGASFINFTWHPVQVLLPISGYDTQSRGQFQGQAFTFAQGNARQGPITQQAGWPVLWNIKGTVTLPPECLIEMTIDETWYPGWDIACEPTGIVGCIYEAWPAGYFPGAKFKIPWDKAFGTSISSGTAYGMPIHLTAIMYHVVTGGGSTDIGGVSALGCEHHLMFPVIPQAEE